MKNKIFSIFVLLSLIFTTSCDKEEDMIKVNGVQTAPVLLPLTSGVILDAFYPDNPALSLTWNDASYGQSVVPNYKVEFSVDNAFTKPYTAVITTNRTFSWTTKQLNTILQDGLRLAPNQTSTIYIRVVSYLGSNNAVQGISNVLSTSVKPYATYSFNDWYLVGNASPDGWNNNNKNTLLFRDPANADSYTFTGYFASGDFKIIRTLGKWAPMYGTNDGGATATYRATESDPDPGVWHISTAGYYTFSVNLSTKAASLASYTGSTSTTYASMGLIGSATAGGWGADTPMTKLPTDPHAWVAYNVPLTGGEAKFRANGTWDANWGASTVYSGIGTMGGPNIPVISGTYNVWFFDLKGQYMFVPVQ